jgi:hypothetical protein
MNARTGVESRTRFAQLRPLAASLILAASACLTVSATRAGEASPPGAPGPYDLTILQGGIGMTRALPADTPLAAAGAAWSVGGWYRFDVAPREAVVLAGLGDPASASCVCLQADAAGVSVRLGAGVAHANDSANDSDNLNARAAAFAVSASAPAITGAWHFVTATYDGTSVRLYLDGAAALRAGVE